jgi:hypothetical protein
MKAMKHYFALYVRNHNQREHSIKTLAFPTKAKRDAWIVEENQLPASIRRKVRVNSFYVKNNIRSARNSGISLLDFAKITLNAIRENEIEERKEIDALVSGSGEKEKKN